MTKINYGEVMQNFREEIEALSKKDKKEIEQKDFPHLLSALPCLLANYPVFSNKIEREDLEKYVHECFGIHDEKSAVENIHSFVFNNTQAQFEYCLKYWQGQAKNLDDADEKTKDFFKKCQAFAKELYPEVLDRGFCGFDFGEAIRMAKECYSVGYLSEEGYHFMLNDIANRAFYTFDSWEDYALSYVCGGTYYLYCKSGGNEEFAKKMCETLMGGIRELYKENGLWAESAWPKGKRYFRFLKDVKKVIESKEAGLVSDRISIDGGNINYMVRIQPVEGTTDSGWQFFHGDESKEYLENVSNTQLFQLNVICNMDSSIIPLLDSPVGTAYRRTKDGTFVKVEVKKVLQK